MKIYIIGPPASGKTTLSKALSKKYNIKRYELDKLVFDDNNNHIRREDVGRSKFIKGLESCDKIYYISLRKREAYKRVITRCTNQKLGKEEYNYPPTLAVFLDMLRVVNSYYKKEKQKLDYINRFKEKLIYLDKEELNKLEKSKEG